MSVLKLLKNDGPKYFKDVQKDTGFSPRIVYKHLTLLKDDGLVACAHIGKRTLYSLTNAGIDFANGAPYSLIWDLFEFQEERAGYAHEAAPSYWNYGLETDSVWTPNTGLKFTGKAMAVLEDAFMDGLEKAIKAKTIAIEPGEGKLLMAFQIDWTEFVKTYKSKGNKIIPYKPTRRQMKESDAIVQALKYPKKVPA